MQEPGPGTLQTDPKLRWKDDFVAYTEVEKSGIGDLKNFYMFLWHWHVKENMRHWATNDNKIEDFYYHKIRPDGVQENVIWWRTTKRINEYLYYTCKLDWQVFGWKATEVMHKGQKVKAGKLGLVIRIWWWVQIDPKNKWEKSFLGPISKWFYQHLNSTEQEYHRDKCREIAKRLEYETKQFFEMATPEHMPRSWFPEEGYKTERQPPRPEDFEHQERRPDHKI